MQAPTTTKNTFPGVGRRPALAWLGLPWATRFEHVAPELKRRLVAARRHGETEMEIAINGVRALLKKTLYRTCRCGGPILKQSLCCSVCRPRSLK